MEILHDDFQLPGEDGGDGVRWHVNDSRRIHVYERCSQFSILQRMSYGLYVGFAHAPAGAGPVPSGAQKCPAQHQKMRDVMVYPDKSALRPGGTGLY